MLLVYMKCNYLQVLVTGINEKKSHLFVLAL